MLKKSTIPIAAFLLLVLLVAANFTFNSDSDQNRNKFVPVAVKENGIQNLNSVQNHKVIVNDNPPAGTIPGLMNYMDYITNGNTLQSIKVYGDTVVVCATYIDSSEAANGNAGTTMRWRYTYSLNGGTTWELDPGLDLTSDRKSRYPDCDLTTIGGQRTIFVSGRPFDSPPSSATRRAGFAFDLSLGAGSPTAKIWPGSGNDLFTAKRIDGKFGGVYESNDSIIYMTSDPNNSGTPFGGNKTLFASAPLGFTNFVASYTIASSNVANHMTAAHIFINPPAGYNRRMIAHQSTDNGVTWSTTEVLASGILNGDSVQAYWHENVVYKPGTSTPYVVFPTTDYTVETNTEITRKSHKIVLWSPAVNGGNPVVIADWHNHPQFSNVAEYDKIATRGAVQVNSVFMNHPSIGFNSNGNVMMVAYTVPQPDTASNGFHYEDVWTQYSMDGGATWSNPVNATNTATGNEKYPTVAPRSNSTGSIPYIYYHDLVPGCHAFTDLVEISQVNVVYSNQLVGIKPIGGEVPNNFVLGQNYPNPFNPTTNFKFSLPKASNVTIKLYDISGREVRTLLNGEKYDAGNYVYEFDAKGLSSGIYFYKMVSDGYAQTRKMILVK